MEFEFYPKDPKAHILNELSTLKFIYDREDIFSQKLYNLYDKAKQQYSKIKSQKTKFILSSKIDIKYNGRDGEAFFGVNIVCNDDKYEELTYYIAICDKMDKRILLKLHFDFSECDIKQRQKHPVSHMHFGGRLSAELKNLNYDYSLSKDLDEPRLFHQPMTFALLLNLILNEFPNETYQKIVKRKEWRDIIHRDENSILADFYKCCHSYIANSHGNKLFTSDFCYGE